MKITSTNCQAFRKDFAEAVKALEAKHDITLDLGNISMYPHSRFTTKLTVKNNKIDGISFEESTFKNEAIIFGFKASDYKRKVKMQGKIFELVGFNRKATKNDCTVATLDGESKYSTSSDTVKRCFV
jgi:hypothetical protein